MPEALYEPPLETWCFCFGTRPEAFWGSWGNLPEDLCDVRGDPLGNSPELILGHRWTSARSPLEAPPRHHFEASLKPLWNAVSETRLEARAEPRVEAGVEAGAEGLRKALGRP